MRPLRCHRDDAGLLRNHDGQGVVLLGDADRSAVPGTQRAIRKIAVSAAEHMQPRRSGRLG